MIDALRRSDRASDSRPLRVALIGHGAIGAALVRLLEEPGGGVDIVAILVRAARDAADNARFVTAQDDLLAARPDLVIECAGHEALRRHGVAVLEAGIDLMLVSAGALVDPVLHSDLTAAARRAGATIEIPGGAIGGVAALAAARLAGLSSVRHTVIKPPQAWRGTLAETLIRLDGLVEACTFFDGTARDAAASYPQNANVSATLALAGLGFERTQVRLVADPQARANSHLIEASGAFGELRQTIASPALADNPKTSSLTAFSVAQAVLRRTATIRL